MELLYRILFTVDLYSGERLNRTMVIKATSEELAKYKAELSIKAQYSEYFNFEIEDVICLEGVDSV